MSPPDNIRVSWTQYLSYSSCGLQFNLRYVDHVRRLGNQQIYLIGRIVHEMIKEWADGGFSPTHFSRANILAKFKEVWTAGGYRLRREKAIELIQRAITAAQETEKLYIQAGFTRNMATIDERFTTPLTGSAYQLTGAIDVYDRTRSSVFDLKLYSNASEKGDVRQLLTYAVAATEQGLPVDRGAFLYPLRRDKVGAIRIPEEAILEQRERLISVANHRKAEDIERLPEEGKYCFFCEYNRTRYCPATYRGRSGRNAKANKDGTFDVQLIEDS